MKKNRRKTGKCLIWERVGKISPEKSEAEWVSIKGGEGGGEKRVEDETTEKARVQHLDIFCSSTPANVSNNVPF